MPRQASLDRPQPSQMASGQGFPNTLPGTAREAARTTEAAWSTLTLTISILVIDSLGSVMTTFNRFNPFLHRN